MRIVLRLLAFGLVLSVAAGACAGEAVVSRENPIVFPRQSVDYVSYPDTILNVLMMGIDFGAEGYWGSGYKKDILNCHTDAVMVLAINLTQSRIDIVSLPRDSVTIVPGVRGVYKLNGAVNCGDTISEGLERTKASAEWLLGGIKIDCYFAVDMNMMFLLGDAIGGVDFEMDMDYTGSSGARYHTGWQHLNGTGIMDYVRARTNATVDGTDLGRARRQRDIMTAVMDKLMGDKQGLLNVLDVLSDPDTGFFTSMTNAQALGFVLLLPALFRMDTQNFTSYSLTGKYRFAMEFNFTFTDQDHRAEVIRAVYGIDVPPLAYVSYEHAKWLLDTGFHTIHVINVAKEFMETVEAMHLRFTGDQQELWDQFTASYRDTVNLFQITADTLDDGDTGRMKTARIAMRNYGDELAGAIGYTEEIPWRYYAELWFDDPYTNEYQLDWR